MAATESAKMQKKSLNSSPDQARTFEKEKIELANLVVMLLVNNKERDLVFKAAEYHVNWFGFNICHKETLQLPVMRLTTLNNH
jgi:hypothetical protein